MRDAEEEEDVVGVEAYCDASPLESRGQSCPLTVRLALVARLAIRLF